MGLNQLHQTQDQFFSHQYYIHDGYTTEKLPFIVIRQLEPQTCHAALEGTKNLYSPPCPASYLAHPGGVCMERTPSGETIVEDSDYLPETSGNYTLLQNTEVAAALVKQHLRRRRHHFHERIHERTLRDLIHAVYLEDSQLDRMMEAVDSVFFNKRLSGRVRWEWSHSSQTKYDQQLIGTTALRPSPEGGFETLVVLSRPLLRSGGYTSLLLVSTFLHELIHCYLFICCGYTAKEQGGHPEGFHQIASIIDDWEGNGQLQLCNIGADLKKFAVPSNLPARSRSPADEVQDRRDTIYARETVWPGPGALFYDQPNTFMTKRPPKTHDVVIHMPQAWESQRGPPRYHRYR